MIDSARIPMTPEQIYEKDFKKDIYGYNRYAVDQFLDEIIKDYVWFQKEIERLEDENIKLKKEKWEIQNRNNHMRQNVGNTNYDILKRLSSLEKKVFKDRLRKDWQIKKHSTFINE